MRQWSRSRKEFKKVLDTPTHTCRKESQQVNNRLAEAVHNAGRAERGALPLKMTNSLDIYEQHLMDIWLPEFNARRKGSSRGVEGGGDIL